MLNSDGPATIRMEGELDIARREDVRSALQIGEGVSKVLIDFSAVTYADSLTLAELLRFRRHAQERDVRLAVLIGSQQFARLIEYAGLHHAFSVFDDRSAALAYLEERTQ